MWPFHFQMSSSLIILRAGLQCMTWSCICDFLRKVRYAAYLVEGTDAVSASQGFRADYAIPGYYCHQSCLPTAYVCSTLACLKTSLALIISRPELQRPPFRLGSVQDRSSCYSISCHIARAPCLLPRAKSCDQSKREGRCLRLLRVRRYIYNLRAPEHRQSPQRR